MIFGVVDGKEKSNLDFTLDKEKDLYCAITLFVFMLTEAIELDF